MATKRRSRDTGPVPSRWDLWGAESEEPDAHHKPAERRLKNDFGGPLHDIHGRVPAGDGCSRTLPLYEAEEA